MKKFSRLYYTLYARPACAGRRYTLNKGFTLIETIVTILIFAILGMMATTTLFSVLRAGTKSEVLKEVKQNGDFALSVMELKIRNARDIVPTCDGTPLPNITILNSDSTQTQFSCTSGTFTQQQVAAPSPQPTPSPANLTNSSVTVPSCAAVFTCTSSSVAPKRVSIQFTLSQSSGTGPVESASQTFQTQVTLRNK